MIIEMNCNLLP